MGPQYQTEPVDRSGAVSGGEKIPFFVTLDNIRCYRHHQVIHDVCTEDMSSICDFFFSFLWDVHTIVKSFRLGTEKQKWIGVLDPLHQGHQRHRMDAIDYNGVCRALLVSLMQQGNQTGQKN